MCIAILCKPGCDVMSFEIKLIFLIKPLFYMTKNSRQKSKYLEKEKSFQSQIKGFRLEKVVSGLGVQGKVRLIEVCVMILL